MASRSRRRVCGIAEQHFLDIVPLDKLPQLIGAVDLELVNVLSPQRGIRVHETDRDGHAGTAQRFEQSHARTSGPVDEHVSLARIVDDIYRSGDPAHSNISAMTVRLLHSANAPTIG